MDFYVSPDSLDLLLPKALVSCQQMRLTTIDTTSLLHLPAVAFFLGDWGPGGHLRHAHSLEWELQRICAVSREVLYLGESDSLSVIVVQGVLVGGWMLMRQTDQERGKAGPFHSLRRSCRSSN